MRPLGISLLVTLLAACSPQGRDQNPRDREGSEGALTWRVVSQSDGQAAFLSRPGAAPDVVLWCRDGQRLILRAHVFPQPASQPDLRLTSNGATIIFTTVRRQGGVRSGDRKLVEGTTSLSDPKIQAILSGAAQFSLQSGDDKYDVSNSDPASILPAFINGCSGAPTLSQPNKK